MVDKIKLDKIIINHSDGTMHVCTYFEPINLVGVYIHISMDKLKILPAGGARREVRESQR